MVPWSKPASADSSDLEQPTGPTNTNVDISPIERKQSLSMPKTLSRSGSGVARATGGHSLLNTAVIAWVSGSAGAPTGRGWSEKSAVTTSLPPPGPTTGITGSITPGETSTIVAA